MIFRDNLPTSSDLKVGRKIIQNAAATWQDKVETANNTDIGAGLARDVGGRGE